MPPLSALGTCFILSLGDGYVFYPDMEGGTKLGLVNTDRMSGCGCALQDFRSWKVYSTLDPYQCRLIDLVIIAVQDSTIWVFHNLLNHFLTKGYLYYFQSLIIIGTPLTALGHASFPTCEEYVNRLNS